MDKETTNKINKDQLCRRLEFIEDDILLSTEPMDE